MTDKKISELTSNGTLTGSELVELVQSGKKIWQAKQLPNRTGKKEAYP